MTEKIDKQINQRMQTKNPFSGNQVHLWLIFPGLRGSPRAWGLLCDSELATKGQLTCPKTTAHMTCVSGNFQPQWNVLRQSSLTAGMSGALFQNAVAVVAVVAEETDGVEAGTVEPAFGESEGCRGLSKGLAPESSPGRMG